MPENQGFGLNLMGGTEDQGTTVVEAIRDFFAMAGIDGITDINPGQIKAFAAIRFFAQRFHPQAYVDGKPKEGYKGLVGFDYSQVDYVKKMNISNKRLGRSEGEKMIRAVMNYDPKEGQSGMTGMDPLKR